MYMPALEYVKLPGIGPPCVLTTLELVFPLPHENVAIHGWSRTPASAKEPLT